MCIKVTHTSNFNELLIKNRAITLKNCDQSAIKTEAIIETLFKFFMNSMSFMGKK